MYWSIVILVTAQLLPPPLRLHSVIFSQQRNIMRFQKHPRTLSSCNFRTKVREENGKYEICHLKVIFVNNIQLECRLLVDSPTIAHKANPCHMSHAKLPSGSLEARVTSSTGIMLCQAPQPEALAVMSMYASI